MKREFTTDDINRIVAQARRERSDAAGKLIVAYASKALVWLATRTDKFLHTFLMSPTAPR